MKLKNFLIKTTAIVVVLFSIESCDDDFNSVGAEVIGDVNFKDDKYEAAPIAYSKVFKRVQTSNLPGNLLGIYNDPVYGSSRYNLLAQVVPERFNVTYGKNAVLDSVVLTLPYLSSQVGGETIDGEIIRTYELDSVYGVAPYTLSLYQSNYFLRSFDTEDPTRRQIYYSDDIDAISDNELEGTFLKKIERYVPSDKEVILTMPDGDDEDTDKERQRLTPRLRMVMSAANGDGDVLEHFKQQFIDKEGDSEFSNSNSFRNFFRGLYFKVESLTNQPLGNLVYFNLDDANLTLHYSFDKADTEPIEREVGSLALNFREPNNGVRSIRVNGITNDFETSVVSELENQDIVNGESDLYLKGGQGSYAVLDLFSRYVETDANGDFVVDENGNPIIIDNPTDGDKTELDFLRNVEWLVNDASLKLYINQDIVTGGETEPERIYIFNEETGQTLFDYALDPTSSDTSPVLSRIAHLGRINRDSDENGEFYRIRMTQHIINVLNGDIDNAKLGIAVSQNVNITANANGFTSEDSEDEIIPYSSVISHEGTVLYGNRDTVPEEKRLKLEIFYTKTKNN